MQFIAINANSQKQSGILIIKVLNYKSDVKLKDEVEWKLKRSGISWYVKDSSLIITQINPQYIAIDSVKHTQCGSEIKIERPVGTYAISCIGYILSKSSKNVQKVLSTSAFFNMNVLKFNILPNKITEITFLPIIQKHKTFLVDSFSPDIHVKIVEDGKVVMEDYQINTRTEASIAWDDYKGPLKFKE